jgi:hypothetical protein
MVIKHTQFTSTFMPHPHAGANSTPVKSAAFLLMFLLFLISETQLISQSIAHHARLAAAYSQIEGATKPT